MIAWLREAAPSKAGLPRVRGTFRAGAIHVSSTDLSCYPFCSRHMQAM